MGEPDDGLQGGVMGHLHRVVIHALGALRCYITLVAAECERRGRRLLAEAMWMLVLAGIGLAGAVLLASGVAQWIESRIGTPGSGAMIVGIVLIVIFLAVVLARSNRKERDS
jgi:hypothetical protein